MSLICLNSKIISRKIKLNDYLEFPTTLKLLNYTQEKLKGLDLKPSSYYTYHLRGFIVHTGTADYGHYYSVIKTNNKWYEFNDKEVKEFDINRLSQEAFGGVIDENPLKTKNAYMLFYERSQYYDTECHLSNYIINNNCPNIISSEDLEEIKNNILMDEYADFVTSFMNTETFYDFALKLRNHCQDSDVYFKFLAKYFLINVIRSYNKQNLKDMYKLFLHLMEQSIDNCFYIIKSFRNKNILFEFLIECPYEDLRLCALGILSGALQNIDKNYLALDENNIKIINDFALNVIQCVRLMRNSDLYSEHQFLLIEDIIKCNNIFAFLKELPVLSILTDSYTTRFSKKDINEAEIGSDLTQLCVTNIDQQLMEKHNPSNKMNCNSQFIISICKTICLYIEKHKLAPSVDDFFDDALLWIQVLNKLKRVEDSHIIANYFSNFTADKPKLIKTIFEQLKITDANFKGILIVFMYIVRRNEYTVNGYINDLLGDFIRKYAAQNYIIFDYMVYGITELCIRSDNFYIILRNNSQTLQLIFEQNHKTKNLASIHQNQVF